MDLLTVSITDDLQQYGFVTVLVPIASARSDRIKQKIDSDYLVLEIHPIKRTSYALLERLVEFTQDKFSEPYSRYTFLHMVESFGNICLLVFDVTPSFDLQEIREQPVSSLMILPRVSPIIDDLDNPSHSLIGVAINTLDNKPHHPTNPPVSEDVSGSEINCYGYLAMVSVEEMYRGLGLGVLLGNLSVQLMNNQDAIEVALETEVTNIVALNLYDKLGFKRIRRMARYYLSGLDAFGLIKVLKPQGTYLTESLLL